MIANKNKIQKKGDSIFLPIALGIIFLGVMVFLVASNIRIIQKRSEMSKEIEFLSQEIILLQEAKEKYEQGILTAEESAYWEERLREQGYLKPGEEMVVILPSEEISEEEEVSDNSILDKIKGFFNF